MLCARIHQLLMDIIWEESVQVISTHSMQSRQYGLMTLSRKVARQLRCMQRTEKVCLAQVPPRRACPAKL